MAIGRLTLLANPRYPSSSSASGMVGPEIGKDSNMLARHPCTWVGLTNSFQLFCAIADQTNLPISSGQSFIVASSEFQVSAVAIEGKSLLHQDRGPTIVSCLLLDCLKFRPHDSPLPRPMQPNENRPR